MSKPIIIGLMSTDDAGKTLLLDLIDKNIPNDILFSFRKDISTNEQRINFIKNGPSNVPDMLTFFGSNLVSLETFYNIIENKDALRNLFSQITDKPYVVIQISPKEFDRYCDYGVFMYRDMRVGWCVTTHRDPGLFSYVSKNNDIFKQFERINDKSNIISIRFENLMKNQTLELDRFFNLIKVDFEVSSINQSSKPYNEYITEHDLRLLKEVNNEELSIIFSLAKTFHEMFGYNKVLRVEDIQNQ